MHPTKVSLINPTSQSKIIGVFSPPLCPQPQHDHYEKYDLSKVSDPQDLYPDALLSLSSSSTPSSKPLDPSTTHKEATKQYSTTSVLHTRSGVLEASLPFPSVLVPSCVRIVLSQVLFAEGFPLVSSLSVVGGISLARVLHASLGDWDDLLLLPW